MKKILLFVFTLLLIIPLSVKADMGAPAIKEYKATPKSKDGATYYDWDLKKKGTIEYEETIEIYSEETINGTLYGMFNINLEPRYVKLSDVKLVDEDTLVKPNKDEKLYKARVFKDVKIYNGPNHSYSSIGELKENTDIRSTYYLDNGTWVYVVTDDVQGYVDASNGTIGLLNKEELIDSKTDKVYEESYELDPWTKEYYVKEDGVYVKLNGYLTGSEFFGTKDVTTTDDVKIYKDLESNTVVTTIPKGAEITVKYVQNANFMSAKYVTYKDNSGWVLEDGYDAFDIEWDDSYNYMDAYVQDGTMEDAKDVPTPKKPKADDKKLSLKEIILICAGGAVILVATAIVIIVTINKKKKKAVVEEA